MRWLLFLMAWLVLPAAYSKPIIIGTAADNPPLSSSADKKSHFYGFEVELMSEICHRMEIDCQFTSVLASQLLTDVSSGKIDLAVDAIIIPSGAPGGAVIFSLPYLPSSAHFIAQKNSAINTLAEIRNKRVGVRLGTLFHGNMFHDYINKMYNYQVQLSSYLTMDDLLNALINDQVDVAFSNTEPIKYWYMNNTSIFKLIGHQFPIGNGYAVMGKQGQEALMSQINETLLKIEQDGTYEKIYNSYFTL